jgi:ABC-type sugar transport system ATPase subunit
MMAEKTDGNKELIFEAGKICKSFGPTLALEHVDLSVYRGEITGLVGENGKQTSEFTRSRELNETTIIETMI